MSNPSPDEKIRSRSLRPKLSPILDRIDHVPQAVQAFYQETWAFLLIIYLGSIGWTVVWAWYDYQVVGLAFPPAAGYTLNTGIYWNATWWVLCPLATVLAFRRQAWLPMLLLMGGWEDIFFYVIVKGAPVPPMLMGVSNTVWFVRAVMSLLATFVGVWAIRRPSVRIHHVPLSPLMVLASLGSFLLFLPVVLIYFESWAILRKQ